MCGYIIYTNTFVVGFHSDGNGIFYLKIFFCKVEFFCNPSLLSLFNILFPIFYDEIKRKKKGNKL